MSKSGSTTRRRPSRLQLESLESRLVPASNVFSGFVYVDTDDNGTKIDGELGIAGSVIQLRDHNENVLQTGRPAPTALTHSPRSGMATTAWSRSPRPRATAMGKKRRA